MGLSPFCVFRRGRSPIVAAAIHHGHDVRRSVAQHLALDEQTRWREEDPGTAELAQIASTQIVGLRSRFEVDLNRPRHQAVYLSPEDAWGLNVWRRPPDRRLVETSLKEYDQFYRAVKELLQKLLAEHARLVVYDIHTYNHRRNGIDGAPADARENPEVNVGTGTMDRHYWGPIVDRFIGDLRAYNFDGRHLDVRENVRFRGGHFGRWIHESFPQRVCAIAIEVKKFFMDEWGGECDPAALEPVFLALKSTLPGVVEELERL